MQKKKNNLVKIEAAGGVLWRPAAAATEILLIKRNGVWDLPKGKLEAGESAENCAVREIAEETGVQDPVINSFLCDTYHEYEQKGRYFGKITHWFSMTADAPSGQLTPQTEEGITDLAWVDVHRAKTMVHFDNLKKVVAEFLGSRQNR